MPEISNQARLDRLKQFTPDSYVVEKCDFIPHTGSQDKYDIRGILSSFSITESIYRQYLTLDLSLVDTIDFNLLGDISGQEKIVIQLSQANPSLNADGEVKGDKFIVNLEFYVVDYPGYAKGPSDQSAVYMIKGVTKEKFESEFLRVSKAYRGSSNKIIKDILINQLNVKKENIVDESGSAEGMFSVIIPNEKPMNAINMILSKAYDAGKSPIYFYQTLDGKYNLKSQTAMYASDLFGKYRRAKPWELQQPKEDLRPQEVLKRFEVLKRNILSSVITPSMSKYSNGSKGTYAATTYVLDSSIKTFKILKYESDKEALPLLEGTIKDNLSSSFMLRENGKIGNMYDARNYHISENSLAMSNFKTLNQDLGFVLAQRTAYYNELDTVIQNLVLNGDLRFNSGKKVEVTTYRSSQDEGVVDATNSKESIDEKLSGKYIVTGVIHNFSENYTMNVRIKKDNVKILNKA